MVNIPRDQLQEAPKGGMEAVADREQGRHIHQFYGVSPYWEEGQATQPSAAPPLPPGHPPILPPGHPPVTLPQQ